MQPVPGNDGLEPLMNTVLGLILSRRGRAPAAQLPRRLDDLFVRLRREGSSFAAERIQDLIWAIWCDHEDDGLLTLMHQGIGEMAEENFTAAHATFNTLVAKAPDWAEPYNKRATLRFIAGRDAEAVADIIEAIEREPRHFGAMSGFGQIALRNGYLHEAVLAFEAVIDLNPHLTGVRKLVAELKAKRHGALN